VRTGATKAPEVRDETDRRPSDLSVPCDVCGEPMKPLGHCKYQCFSCGFLRTCNDTI
jgi:hypothetical protein